MLRENNKQAMYIISSLFATEHERTYNNYDTHKMASYLTCILDGLRLRLVAIVGVYINNNHCNQIMLVI